MKRIRIAENTVIYENNVVIDIVKPANLTFRWVQGGEVTVNNNSGSDCVITGTKAIESESSYTIPTGSGATFFFDKEYYIKESNVGTNEQLENIATIKKQFNSKWGGEGDSIMNFDNSPEPDKDWIGETVFRLKGEFVINSGVAGSRSFEVLARIKETIIDKGVKICPINIGTNDVSNGDTVDEIITNIRAIYELLIANDVMPVACTVTPRDFDAFNQTIIKLNRKIVDISNELEIPVIDFYSVMVDASTGFMNTSYEDDGLHPNNTGNRIMADEAVRSLSEYFKKKTNVLTASDFDDSNLLSNALFLNGTSDWNIVGTDAVYTQEADVDIIGKWLKIVRTNNDQEYIQQTLSVGTDYDEGDVLNFSGAIKSSGAELGGLKYSVFIFFLGSSQSITAVNEFQIDLDYAEFNFNAVVPDGSTSGFYRILTKDGAGTLQVGQVSIRNLTREE